MNVRYFWYEDRGLFVGAALMQQGSEALKHNQQKFK